MRRFATLSLLILQLSLTATSALAQPTPYSPLPPNPSEHLRTGRFERSPLKLPFREVASRAVPTPIGQDFEHTYEVSRAELIAHFTDPKQRESGFDLFDPARYPEARGLKLRVMGERVDNSSDENVMMFGHPKLSRLFQLRISEAQGRAVVVLENIVNTNPASGVMPARHGFMPIGVDVVLPFRWN